MTGTSSDAPFEKTFRLVCRLDDADIARALELDPGASAYELTPRVVDMSTRGRWRLMRPEIVGEQLAQPATMR